MTTPDNPAGRLHLLLSAVASSQANLPMAQVWGNVLNIDSSNTVEIAKRLGAVYDLIDETKRLISLNPNINHQRYLANFGSIEYGVSPMHLGNSLTAISGSFSPEVLARLEFCSDALQRFHAEVDATPEELESLKTVTDSLYDSLLESGIDETLKIQLLEEVTRIRTALSIYRIRGAVGVKEALQALLGCVMVNHEAIKKTAESDPNVFQQVGEVIDQLDTFSGKITKLHTLISATIRRVLQLSGSGSSPSNSGVSEAADNEMEI